MALFCHKVTKSPSQQTGEQMKNEVMIAGMAAVVCGGALVCSGAEPEQVRPNILWIMIEDWCPDLSCYGTKGIQTPNVDKLASEGIRYTRAFTTAPVCSPARSAMMTGFHQNYIGANQHRTKDKKSLPHGIKPLPVLLKEAGYYTAKMQSGKTDCNFSDNLGFMGKDWNKRQNGQPFFVQATFADTHRTWKRDKINPIDVKDIELPPYYADTDLCRRDWANGLEQMQLCDRKIGKFMKRLKDDGLADNTVVFIIGDNGRCHFRGKQFLYDPGLLVPLIVRWPGNVEPGQVSGDLVMSIDITKTIMDIAKLEPPQKLHGKNLFGKEVGQRKYVFAARDKMDDTHDAMRMIRSKDFKLIHNLMPERPWLQYNWYKEARYPMLAEMNVLNAQGKLNTAQSAFFAKEKPEFELFEMQKDPHEINNLADDPKYASVKSELLNELNKLRKSINDQGVSEEFRKGGWSADFPTRSLEEWQDAVKRWKPWVLRNPEEKVKFPKI